MPLTNKKGLPSFATAGLCCRGKLRDRLRNATLTRSDGPEDGAQDARLRDDLSGDVADAGAGQADGAGSARGQVKHTALDEGTTVIDRDDDALATMGHPELGAERQRAVGRGHGVLVEALSGGGLAAGFIAVKRSPSREAVPGARADRGIGVHPVALGLVGMSVVGMVAVMPGFGGGFGDAATDQESCGDQGESRARPG
jgi:hypothetical protein